MTPSRPRLPLHIVDGGYSLIDNKNNNDTWENIYGAVIMTQVISRVHTVHLTNVGQRQADADPQIRSTNLDCESACRLLYGRLHTLSPFIITQPKS